MSNFSSLHLCIFASLQLCIFSSLHLCIFSSLYLCIFSSVYLCIFASLQLCIFSSLLLKILINSLYLPLLVLQVGRKQSSMSSLLTLRRPPGEGFGKKQKTYYGSLPLIVGKYLLTVLVGDTQGLHSYLGHPLWTEPGSRQLNRRGEGGRQPEGGRWKGQEGRGRSPGVRGKRPRGERPAGFWNRETSKRRVARDVQDFNKGCPQVD